MEGLVMNARHLLGWAAGSFPPGRLALVSSFGAGGLVLIHLLAELRARLPVVFVDTLYHFPETLAHVERVRAHYEIDLHVFRPAASRAAFETRHGPRLWDRDLDRFHRLTKVEPFRRAVGELHAYITGRRRDQAPTRAQLKTVQGESPLTLNPLATWPRQDVWRFIHTHGIPYNPLHDRGYASIGDAPLTTPIQPGEPERAGRWRGLGRLECGIHVVAQSSRERTS